MTAILDPAPLAAADEAAGVLLAVAVPLWLQDLGLALLLLGLIVGGGALVIRKVRSPRHDPHADDTDDWPLPPLIVPPGLSENLPVPQRPPASPAPFNGGASVPEPAAHAGRAAGDVAYQPSNSEPVQAGRVLFHRPPEGTLQLLPGRLEIVSGHEQLEEIRFVRVPGREAVVTFGRNAGEPHVHVQLQSPTVSRMHAVMRYAMGRWHITNLSQTNPVLVRGAQLPADGAESVALQDGDLIEMGEVTFVFRLR